MNQRAISAAAQAPERHGAISDSAEGDGTALRRDPEAIPANGHAPGRLQALLLSVNETAELLGIHRATVYDLLAQGQLRSTTLGRRRLIPRAAVEAFVEAFDERARREAEEQRALAECCNRMDKVARSA